MRHVTIDAEQFIAVAQALAARIDQEQDRPLWRMANGIEHSARHGKRQLDTDFGVIGRADDGKIVRPTAPTTRQKIPLLYYRVALRKQLLGNNLPIHSKSSLYLCFCVSGVSPRRGFVRAQ